MKKTIIVNDNSRASWVDAYRRFENELKDNKTDSVLFHINVEANQIKPGNEGRSVFDYYSRIITHKEYSEVEIELNVTIDNIANEDVESIRNFIINNCSNMKGVKTRIRVFFAHINNDIFVENNFLSWTDAFGRMRDFFFPFFNSENSNLDLLLLPENIDFCITDLCEDVCELRYYLPINNYLNRIGITSNLVINCDLQKNGYYFRINQLFLNSNISVIDENGNSLLSYSSLNYTDNENEYASDILPIVTIDKNSGDFEICRLIEIYKQKIFSRYNKGDFLKGYNENEMSISQRADIVNELIRILFGDSVYKEFAVIGNDEKWKSISRILLNDNLLHFSKENNISILVFFFLLREFINNKRALINDKEKGWKWDSVLIRKIIMDSKIYGEGIQQLVENSHEHSKGRVAYFGMRLHNADIETSMNEIVKNSQTREMLWRKYANTQKTHNVFNEKDTNGNKKYPGFLEVFLLDDAVDFDNGWGIVDAINSDQKSLKNTVTSIDSIFSLDSKDYSNEKSFYIKHYGMRWFLRHIKRINGIMKLYSPFPTSICLKSDDDIVSSYYYSNIKYTKDIFTQIKGIKNDDSEVNNSYDHQYTNLFTTTYSILIPISYKSTIESVDAKAQYGPYFESNISDFSNLYYKKIEIDKEYVAGPINNRINTIEDISSIINRGIHSGDSTCPVLINASDIINTSISVELFAKSLFLVVLNSYKENKTRKIRIAIDFGEKYDYIDEFIRIYSIFYLKQNKNEYMVNVQIALCSSINRENSPACEGMEVNFILAGKNIETALETANNFVFYNSESALKYVPLLIYLTKDNSTNSENAIVTEHVPLFPFELIPTKKNGTSVFINHMDNVLNNDVWKDSPGCKISDVRVRLGSKIQIDNFYAAELLFHNVGNIKRFAYLIAQNILEDIKADSTDLPTEKKKKIIYVIGYASYSEMLIIEVKSLLNGVINKDFQEVLSAIDINSGKAFPCMNLDKIDNVGCISVYTIVPVGTTMSTVYKMHESFKRGLIRAYEKDRINVENDININFRKNYSIIAVGDCFDTNCVPEEDCIYDRYFYRPYSQRYNCHWYRVNLKPDRNNKDGKQISTQVNYCLAAPAKWYRSDIQNIVNETDYSEGGSLAFYSRPLICVDKTSTLLNASFELMKTKDSLKYYNRIKNSKTIKELDPKGYEGKAPMYYGHFCNRENHYQFYFDYKLITKKNEKEKGIEKWLEMNNNVPLVEPDAYNIVISPLSETNGSFLSIVLEKSFGTNFHLLHIDINSNSKEDVRLKYNYISKELKEMKNSFVKVNFYYIDESVYSGKTIQRAAKLIEMLLEHAGVSLNSISGKEKRTVFKKVILLLNRSSYETAYQWVDKPCSDWVAYIDLLIPNYNMHGNECPACIIKKRYELLYKRSSTDVFSLDDEDSNNLKRINEGMATYFKNMMEKHQQKSIEQYLKDIDFLANNCEKYIKYKKYEKENCNIEENSNVSEYKKELLSFDKKTLKKIISYCNWIETYKNYKRPQGSLSEVLNKIINQNAYLRLYTMNKAYKELIYNPDLLINAEGPEIEEIKKRIEEQILMLLLESFNESARYDKIMMFISYIKVISREYISRFYLVRESIYTILHCLFLIMIAPINVDNQKGRSEEQLYFEMQQLFENGDADTKFYYKKILDNWKSYCTIICNLRNYKEHKIKCDLQLRVVKVLIHRLALLHSSFIIKPSIIQLVYEAYNQMKKDKDDRPDENASLELVNNYLISVKTATMVEDDDEMCFALHNLYTTIDELLKD